MAASRIDSAVTSLGCTVSPPEGGSFRGWKRREGSRVRLSSTTTAIRATSTSRFSTIVPLVRVRWGNRCLTDYDMDERGRSANGDIAFALDTPPWGLATKVDVAVENSFRWLLPEFYSIDKVFHERFRASLIDCVSMNRWQAIVSDGSMLTIDGAGEGLLTSFLAIVDLRSTR